MGVKILQSGINHKMDTVDSHLVLENNTRMRSEYERIGCQVVKKFRIYQKELQRSQKNNPYICISIAFSLPPKKYFRGKFCLSCLNISICHLLGSNCLLCPHFQTWIMLNRHSNILPIPDKSLSIRKFSKFLDNQKIIAFRETLFQFANFRLIIFTACNHPLLNRISQPG